MQLITRKMHQVLRARFAWVDKRGAAYRAYDLLKRLSVKLYFDYALGAFALLDLHKGIAYWRSLYYFGHVLPAIAMVFVVILEMGSKPSAGKDRKKAE
jgi:hypothetical protein